MTVTLGRVVMPSNLSEALNTSRPRKMMKEAACATNFIKGLRRIFPSYETTRKKHLLRKSWLPPVKITIQGKKKDEMRTLSKLCLFLKSYTLWKLPIWGDASSKKEFKKSSDLTVSKYPVCLRIYCINRRNVEITGHILVILIFTLKDYAMSKFSESRKRNSKFVMYNYCFVIEMLW